LVAGFVDILLVQILVVIAWVNIDLPKTSNFGLYLALGCCILFLILTSVSIIITGGTAGDRMMNIRCVHENNSSLEWLLLRNFLLGLLIYLPYVFSDGLVEFLMQLTIAVVLLPMPFGKDKSIVLSGLDMILKTRYQVLTPSTK
jgi:hypothetical protein